MVQTDVQGSNPAPLACSGALEVGCGQSYEDFWLIGCILLKSWDSLERCPALTIFFPRMASYQLAGVDLAHKDLWHPAFLFAC